MAQHQTFVVIEYTKEIDQCPECDEQITTQGIDVVAVMHADIEDSEAVDINIALKNIARKIDRDYHKLCLIGVKEFHYKGLTT